MEISITNGTLTATINAKGAELISLTKAGTEYMWEGNPEFWGKHSPVLFPIVGTLKNNSYNYNGNTYSLSRHGFARDNDFAVINKDANTATFLLAATDASQEKYPFDFELALVYTLHESELTIEYHVTNKGTAPMPFSIGAHPAFALPGKFEGYSLKFEKHEPLVSTQLTNDLLSDISQELPADHGELPLAYNLFERDALIFKSLESKSITIKKEGKEYLAVRFFDFPHLGIWTKTGAPFLCIEPWQGYSDTETSNGDIVTKEGIINLEAANTYKAAFTITIF
ncbi:aldose 1-epimerase family protein [Flavobacterium sp. RHBU_24]|uniref:aldose 1-epimerase family protein n=1 Tax=Flavobacterium sp. RHBU_24 TaxID=3391185 RepID=UPI0039848375